MYAISLRAFLAATQAALDEASKGKNRAAITSVLARALQDAKDLAEKLQPVRRRIPSLYKALSVLTNSLDGLNQSIQSKDVNVTKFRALVKTVQGFGLTRFEDQLSQEANQVSQLDEESTPAATQAPGVAQEEDDSPAANVSRLADKFKVKVNKSPLAIKLKPGKVQRPKPLTTDDIDMPTRVEVNDRLAVVDAEKKAKRDAAYREREEAAFQKLHDAEADRTKLPRKLSGPFALAKHPIVPLLKNEFNLDSLVTMLKQHRIDAVKAGSYLALNGQTLLAIDTAYLTAKKIKQKPEQYAEHVISVINGKASHKYGLMSLRYRSNPSNPAIKLFWVMQLNRVPPRLKPGNIQDWDLLTARQVDDVEAELQRINAASVESERLAQKRKDQLLEERLKHAAALNKMLDVR